MSSDGTQSAIYNMYPFVGIKVPFFDELHPTGTSKQQIEVEKNIEKIFNSLKESMLADPNFPELNTSKTENYIEYYFTHPAFHEAYDCNRPWLCYWMVHSLNLMKKEINPVLKDNIVQFLSRCQSPEGGFCGGPGQYPHLAPTYASINALCGLDCEEAYKVINRKSLHQFLWKVRVGDGSFRMQEDGEIDMRSLYCALSVAYLTNVCTPKLFENSVEWILRCQTYEGGFAGSPGMEAHGGYTFCGIASLALLSSQHLADIKALLRWTVNRQMRFEGGFQGRTNKLVDSCYSFWQGSTVSIIQTLLMNNKEEAASNGSEWFFNGKCLQEYILLCCQAKSGGMIDKPSKLHDPYHTCYALSGLSIAQHLLDGTSRIVGGPSNELAVTHPVFNIEIGLCVRAKDYFAAFSNTV